MNFLKKHWGISFVILALGINLLVTNPMKSKYDLIFFFELDLMYEDVGIIERVDQLKYCDLLKEFAKNKSCGCDVNLNYWRHEYARDRIKINSGKKPVNELFKSKLALKEKIKISEWFSWGLIVIFILLSLIRKRSL